MTTDEEALAIFESGEGFEPTRDYTPLGRAVFERDEAKALLAAEREKVAKIRAVLPDLPDCRKHADMGGMIECFVLLEPEPCWSCRIRGALAGIEPPVDLLPEEEQR